jgi:SIR2-like domain
VADQSCRFPELLDPAIPTPRISALVYLGRSVKISGRAGLYAVAEHPTWSEETAGCQPTVEIPEARCDKLNTFEEGVEELQKLLETGLQVWLMGAGVSVESNIPLMYALTDRVRGLVGPANSALLAAISSELPTSATVEHILSHIGDLVAIADRTSRGMVALGGEDYGTEDLKSLHAELVRHIAGTVRYGYRASTEGTAEGVGTIDSPIVEVTQHRNFMSVLFSGRANLESRSRVVFVTTNYDTLIEDSLAMSRRRVFDGFSSGGIGFWIGHEPEVLEKLPPRTHQVIKLHGSVDWLRSEGGAVVRARYGTSYLSDLESTIIYPQATKYVETQRDPFAQLFRAFRRNLAMKEGHVLCVVGYSFGDEHVNLEIEEAMLREGSKTNVIAFSRENVIEDRTELPRRLQLWLAGSFGDRVYVASDRALYSGSKRFEPSGLDELSWWNFAGLVRFLESGVIA